MTKLIIGLGNPGPRYRNTRHNVGFSAIVALSEQHRITGRARGQAVVGEGTIANAPVLLAQPTTMMNASGRAVGQLVRALNLQNLEDLLVIYDEMDLPLGTVRMRAQGSAGGHNGVKSIIATLGTQTFPRLRIGVGRPTEGDDAIDHVLARFRPDEQPILAQVITKAVEIVEAWITLGTEATMNEFNRWHADLPPATPP